MPIAAVVRDPSEAAALMDPMRLRILGILADSDSAAGVARKLGLPRQKTNYHLRELEKAGLVREVARRKKGNCMERLVRATARSYLISPEVLGPLGADPDRIEDRQSSAYLLAVAARIIREGPTGERPPAVSVDAELRFASESDREAFAEDLAAAVSQLVREYHVHSGGTVHRMFAGAYPSPD